MRIIVNGKVVLLILRSKGETQEWLAGQLGVSPIWVNYLIKGHRAPGPRLIKRFVNVFPGKRWNDLFTIKDGTATAIHNR
jgi:hypothetical protein